MLRGQVDWQLGINLGGNFRHPFTRDVDCPAPKKSGDPKAAAGHTAFWNCN